MDLSKLSLGDKVMAGSGIALFIFSFFPWFEYSAFGFSVSQSGWDFFFTGIVPVLLGLILVGYVVVTKVLDGVTLPELPVAYPLLVLGLGAAAAVLVVLRLLMGGDDAGTDVLDRAFGIFLATLAAVGLGAGAFLKFQEEGGELPTKKGGGSSTGSEPPTPF
jgi:hypothetical protein